MPTIEYDETYKGHGECGTITCAFHGCDVKVRYNCDAATRPIYCLKHTKEKILRGHTDVRAKNTAIKRRSMQELIEEK